MYLHSLSYRYIDKEKRLILNLKKLISPIFISLIVNFLRKGEKYDIIMDAWIQNHEKLILNKFSNYEDKKFVKELKLKKLSHLEII